jgi:acyl-coenzyme A thioesterase PaaI-like protein
LGGERNWKTIDWNELDFLKWPGLALVEARDGHSVMELSVEDHHRGGGGSPETVNGGIISYMFDATCGAAVIGQATMTLNVQFLSALNAREKVRCEARITRRGGTVAYVEGKVFDDDGEVGASCVGIFKLFKRR